MMKYGEKSEVKNEKGETTATDHGKGNQVWRYDDKGLIQVDDGKNVQECCGTDFFGNPIYKQK